MTGLKDIINGFGAAYGRQNRSGRRVASIVRAHVRPIPDLPAAEDAQVRVLSAPSMVEIAVRYGDLDAVGAIVPVYRGADR